MVKFNHSLYCIVKNAFYRVVMVNNQAGKSKEFAILGEGVEGAIHTYQNGGYFIKEFEKMA